jgi:hypothetical protein
MQHLYYHTQALQPLNSEQGLQILLQHQLKLQEHQPELQKPVHMQHEHQAPTDLRKNGPMTWQRKSGEASWYNNSNSSYMDLWEENDERSSPKSTICYIAFDFPSYQPSSDCLLLAN